LRENHPGGYLPEKGTYNFKKRKPKERRNMLEDLDSSQKKEIGEGRCIEKEEDIISIASPEKERP